MADLLRKVVELHGSDLHVTTGTPPRVRIDGDLWPLAGPPLTPWDTRQLAYSVLSDAQRERFEAAHEFDFAFDLDGVARFRGNVFKQRDAVAAVYRLIPATIATFADLGLPAVLTTLAERPRGLVLVTGPTGSGKSTTLAAMIDKINRERRGHILTVEDPVEFLHEHRGCLVNQREVQRDTQTFSSALRSALREDPDIVLIGELRDVDTVESALGIAETGHLTLGTLHTNSAPQTVNRIVDIFPSHQHGRVRAQLSFVLEGIVCQTLLPKTGGGRVPSLEVLVATPAIRNLIREDKVHQIYSVMQTGGKSGMQTANQSLVSLYIRKLITLESAILATSNREELHEMLRRGAGVAA